MVYLILTKKGFQEHRKKMCETPSPAWLNAGLFPEDEIAEMRKQGAEITVFSHKLSSGELAPLEDELATIAEHHPGHRVWVEYVPRF